MRHTPVLLKEVIGLLNVKKGGLYIDATAGEGGHLRAILDRGGKVLAIDWDINQIKNLSSQPGGKSENLILVEGNFGEIEKIAKEEKFFPVDGIIFDLGLSYGQISQSGKGFSYNNQEEPLDMRLSNKIERRACDLVNNLSQENLYEILAKYSEEVNSWAIAQSIISARSLKKINTVGNLLRAIDKAVGRKDIKVYSRVFQALRIAVNDEFNNLKKGLTEAIRILKEDGRIIVITFQSLEDRIVKRFVKENNLVFFPKKPIVGNKNLPFERSAKLRVIYKTNEIIT